MLRQACYTRAYHSSMWISESTSMKYTKLSAFILCLAPLISFADDSGKSQSIMFDQEPAPYGQQETFPPYDQKTESPATTNSTEDYCAGLVQKIEDLKGRPLKRTAARERYELECTNADNLQ